MVVSAPALQQLDGFHVILTNALAIPMASDDSWPNDSPVIAPPLQSCAVESGWHYEPDRISTDRAGCVERLDILEGAALLAQNTEFIGQAEGSTAEQIMEVFLESSYDLVDSTGVAERLKNNELV